jgi:phage/plasmid-associated DNA primase
MILNHVGSGFDAAVRADPWCASNGILSGGDYLKCWVASLFQFPERPLPYLFLYGPEKSGKSIFHEALSELITSKGYQRADTALLSPSGFNNELRHAVLCVIEETNLSTKNRTAYNRMKDWVTSPMIQIHPKGCDPYMIKNNMKFIQCSNFKGHVYIPGGDTRVIVGHVMPPEVLLDKFDLIDRCKKEAPDFLGALFQMDIPKSSDKRLNLPVLETSEKTEIQEANLTTLQLFIKEKCYYVPGEILEFAEFYDEFQRWCDSTELAYWTKIRVGKEIPDDIPKARRRGDNHLCLGNIAWEKIETKAAPLIVLNNILVPKGT